MEPDLLLAHLLRLRAAMDCALEAAVPVSDDDVYALVGLLDELDRALRSGAGLPSRWSPRRARRSVRGLTLDLSVAPSNDNSQRRRRARVRCTRTNEQLALPWVG
jgi:hypothetical protein